MDFTVEGVEVIVGVVATTGPCPEEGVPLPLTVEVPVAVGDALGVLVAVGVPVAVGAEVGGPLVGSDVGGSLLSVARMSFSLGVTPALNFVTVATVTVEGNP